jgi:hypothetical protein
MRFGAAHPRTARSRKERRTIIVIGLERRQ